MKKALHGVSHCFLLPLRLLLFLLPKGSCEAPHRGRLKPSCRSGGRSLRPFGDKGYKNDLLKTRAPGVWTRAAQGLFKALSGRRGIHLVLRVWSSGRKNPPSRGSPHWYVHPTLPVCICVSEDVSAGTRAHPARPVQAFPRQSPAWSLTLFFAPLKASSVPAA